MSDEKPPVRRAFVTRLEQLRWTPGERASPAVTPFADKSSYVKATAAELEQRVDEDLMRCAHEDAGPAVHPGRPVRAARPSQT
jgi:hypothetical protein